MLVEFTITANDDAAQLYSTKNELQNNFNQPHQPELYTNC